MNRTSGYSWVEVLVVIAVLWILAVLVISNFPVLLEANRMAKGQQAAMSLASLALAARNSGHPGWANRSDAVLDLLNGVSVTNPADPRIVIRFQGKILTSQECANAISYLSSDGKILIYVPSGGQATNL